MIFMFPIGSEVFYKFENNFFYLQYYEYIKIHSMPFLNIKRCHLYDLTTLKGHVRSSGWCQY